MLTLVTLWLLIQTPARAIDTCALVSSEDVQRILGAPITERRASAQDSRGLLMHQCYVSTGTSRSISIAVAGNPKQGDRNVTPRQFWREQFHQGNASARERDKADDGEADGAGIRSIRGVGDEAFWSGTRVAGALYVLHGRTFIRVSVGGIPDEHERIEKSRQLAAAALARLPSH